MRKMLFFLFTFALFSYSDVILLSDPDIVSSGLEYNKTLQLMLGEEISFKGITLSGLVHVRNEERFNQGLFPNHNWRGIISLNYNTDSLLKSIPLSFTIGIKHESAHPTMGICCQESHQYEKVYDGQYRRYLLNSVDLSIEKRLKPIKKLNLQMDFNYHFYFYSKNTPELIGMQSTIGNGFSGGLEVQFYLNDHFIFLSFFDRAILKSKTEGYDRVYLNVAYDSLINYPIINSVNTVKGKVGISLDLQKIKRKVNVYTSLLYGNIYGFVDSREKRLSYTILGVEILH